VHIQQSPRDGCLILKLTGDLDIVAAPRVQRALLKGLAEQPDAVICDLSNVARIDPVCASVFAAVAHRPRSRWPDSSVLLCGARPAVAEVLRRQGMARVLPICDTLDQAIAQARSRPPLLRERRRLVPTLQAVSTARWFVGEVCQRWQLEELTEAAQSLAAAVVTEAALDQPTASDLIELRLELRAAGLLLAFHSGAFSRAVPYAGHQGDPGSGLEVVRRRARRWGMRRQADGSRVLWYLLR
jgi:anti-anti-sigma factor